VVEARKGVAGPTVAIYLSGLARFEDGHADVDLRAVTRQDIEGHAAAPQSAGLAPSTVHIWRVGSGASSSIWSRRSGCWCRRCLGCDGRRPNSARPVA